MPGGEEGAGLSSGGFSNYWPMPTYQKEAVGRYLKGGKNLPSPSVGYNTSGRAYPDISAQARHNNRPSCDPKLILMTRNHILIRRRTSV